MTELIFSTVPLAQGNQLYLERPRVRRLLEAAMQSPVITITAGAGYGKTQAVYSFLQSCEALTSWMQLSERDNIPERFWENFIAGVSFIDKESARRLAEIGFPYTERGFDRYLAIPQEDVIPHARYIFVYDDFHLIRNKDVLRFIQHSIATPFPNIRSIILSRTPPGINTAALDMRHMRTAITGEALRFTGEETAEYFRIQGINVSHKTSDRICRDTEGWAFAIHLSALFLKRLPVPDAQKEGHGLPGMRSNVFRLLETEIMEPASPELRKFLIKLSLVDLLPRELLEALDTGGNLVAEMEQIISFIRYNPNVKSYSIHQLFLEYLTSRQEELTPPEKQQVYHTAAQWCVENNRKIDAIAYYEKAGDYNSIITIFNRLPQILPNHTAQFLKELLDRTPESQYRDTPLLYVIYGKVYISLGLFKECTEQLWKVIRETERSLAAGTSAGAATGAAAGTALHQVLLTSYLNLGTVGFINSTNTGDFGFVEYYKKAAHYSPLSGQTPRPPVSVANIGTYVCRVLEPEEERITAYLRALEESVPIVAQALGGCMYGLDELGRGEYAYFRGDLADAEKHIGEALQRSREREQFEIENRSLSYLLRIAIHRENYSQTAGILRDLSALREQEFYSNRNTQYDIVMGWFYTQIGEAEKLAPWLKNDFEESDLNSRGQGLEILVKAKYHLLERKYPAALASLTNRIDYEGKLLFGRLETLALEAVCRYSFRDRDGALNVLRQAYELSEQSGIAMPFTELGRFMRSFADWALKEGPEGIKREWLLEQRRNAAGYAKKLFSIATAFREQGWIAEGRKDEQSPDRPYAITLRGPAFRSNLSRREQEVLSCLSRGLTRTEIAGTLSISVNTVKSIIRSIYNKLGAVNRSNAVKVAATTGLLETDD
jgi:LuxR family maltose regulon positive regulatory protein